MIVLFSLLISSCQVWSNNHDDPFYRWGSEWGYLRFPLIRPYCAIYSNDEFGWQIPLETDPSLREFYYYFSLNDVHKIAVEKGVIMVYTPFKQPVEESIGEKVLYWFVFVPDQKIEKGFDNEPDFLGYIKQFGIGDPAWRAPDDILREYDETGCLDRIPNCK